MSRHAAASHTARRLTRARLTWAISAVVIMVAAVVVGFVVSGRPVGPPMPVATSSVPVASSSTVAPSPPVSSLQPQSTPIPPTTLESDFEQLQSKLNADIGLVVTGVGKVGPAVRLGKWSTGPAWSTIKVALVIAALRAQGSPDVTGAMRNAIVNSDNDAAESIWEGLGDPATAAGKVEEVLRQYGDPTVVESRRLRPEFSAFGQTDWSLLNQATFVADAVCDGGNGPVFDLMGQIATGQRWGIGNLPDSRFKGGWGPSTSGGYLVRQIGVFPTATGRVAVAMAAQPASGSFTDGTQDLDEIAAWLRDHEDALPSGQC